MSIGIVGAGISGLHLALRLQQIGVDAVLHSPQDPDDLRAGPPLNFVTRFASTREREAALGISKWASSDFDNPWMHMRLEGANLGFTGKLPQPASSVDFRMYLAHLLEEYVQRGGKVERLRPLTRSELAKLGQQHDLLVVAAGRGALSDVFPRDPARSPYRTAQRQLLGGLFTGVRPPEPAGMTMNMVPGAGEVHAPTYHSFGGPLTAILIEAAPGGPFEEVALGDYHDAPELLAKQVLDLITHHAPSLRERVDEREFGLARPVDKLQGALVPTVRHSVAEVADGRFAVAVGDAWIVNDPLTAQGANLGSQQAFQIAHLLSVHNGPHDETFCRMVADTLWQTAQPVVDWTNTFLGEPPAQVRELLGAASSDQRVADAFVANLDRPQAMWQSIRTPQATAEFLVAVRSAS